MKTNTANGWLFKPLLLFLFCVLAACLYPPTFLYSSNAGGADFVEIIPTTLLFCVIGFEVFVFNWLILSLQPKTKWKDALPEAAIITALFMLVLLKCALIEDLFNRLHLTSNTGILFPY